MKKRAGWAGLARRCGAASEPRRGGSGRLAQCYNLTGSFANAQDDAMGKAEARGILPPFYKIIYR